MEEEMEEALAADYGASYLQAPWQDPLTESIKCCTQKLSEYTHTALNAE